jgi:hypothetical protein
VRRSLLWLVLVLACDSSALPGGGAAPDAAPEAGAVSGNLGGAGAGGVAGTGGVPATGGVPGTGGASTGGTGGVPLPVFPDAGAPPDAARAPDGGVVGAYPVHAVCEVACRNAVVLACPRASTCTANCEESFVMINDIAPCRAPLERFLTCAAGRPPADWECDADGELAIKDGVCDPETQALVMCILGA